MHISGDENYIKVLLFFITRFTMHIILNITQIRHCDWPGTSTQQCNDNKMFDKNSPAHIELASTKE